MSSGEWHRGKAHFAAAAVASALIGMALGQFSPGSPSASAPVLVVSVRDTTTGEPVPWAEVVIGRPYVLASEPDVDPVSGERLSDDSRAWFAYTDSSGRAVLSGFPPGERFVRVCSNFYGTAWGQVMTEPGRTDSLRFLLRYLGDPGDGRRCEVRVQIDGTEDPLTKARKP